MPQKILRQLSENWQNELRTNKAARLKLQERYGIKLNDELDVGLVKFPPFDELPKNIESALSSFGVLDKTLEGMVSLPLRTRDNRIVNFLFISLNGKHDKILRRGGLINLKAFNVFKRLIVVDSLADFLAYYQNVKENVVPVIQSERMMKDFSEAVKASKVSELIFINNSPYWDDLKPLLKDAEAKIFEIGLPGGKALKDYLEENSQKRFLAYIEGEKAKQLQAVKDSEPEEKKERFRVVEDIGEMRFITEDRTYRVRGFNRDGFEKIVQMSLEVDERAFPDKVDLSRSQGRGRFAGIAGAEFDMSAEEIREDLTFIYKTLDGLQDDRFKEKTGINIVEKHIITKKDESRAIDNLCSRDLFNETLLKDTEKLGFVGEEINKKLYYLAATSRLTGKPLPVLVIASSGSGKSFGLSNIMELVPPEEVLKYSRITQHALYYKAENELAGKVMYLEEIIGMEEALKSIRMLLSSGELAVSVTEKDQRTGMLRTVERRIKVDIPVVSSGVREVWDEESLSRFLVTYNDETLQHKQRVLKAQAHQYSLEGEKAYLHRQRVLKKHRDIQKVLDPEITVVNPYADKIMVNPNLHIVTRKQEQYLRIIYNLAFVRQHSREKKTAEDRYGNAFRYVEVMREDIETANEIALHVFKYARGGLTRTLHEGYLSIRKLIEEKLKHSKRNIFEIGVTKKELMDRYHWPETTARRYLNTLLKHEYLIKVKESRRKQFTYRLLFVGDDEDDGLDLLDPDKLQ